MSKIVIVTLGTLGDLHPQIALALELQKRGHQIKFGSQEKYRSKIESLGLEFCRVRPDSIAIESPEGMAKMMDLRTGSEYIIRDFLLPSLRETYADLLMMAENADLIISGGIVFATPLVAEKLGIPWVLAVVQPAGFFSAYDPSVIPLFPALAKLRGFGFIFNRAIVQIMKLVTKSWAEPIHQLRAELGLTPVQNPLMDGDSPYLTLAMFSSVLAKPQLDWSKNTIQTGFTFYDDLQARGGLSDELEQFLSNGEPPIVFTLGSAAVVIPGTFYQESIKAVKLLNQRAVLLIGNNPPPFDLSDDIIAVDYVAYSQIFPYACAIVHQGGIGTTAQALRSGRPTLIMPYSHDQPDNAARVERLGTSRTISRQDYTGARVAKEIMELRSNPNYTLRAAEVAAILKVENGVATACDVLELKIFR
jgi:rhamnosyltransferase subunit B